jgi:hypothetical protein
LPCLKTRRKTDRNAYAYMKMPMETHGYNPGI